MEDPNQKNKGNQDSPAQKHDEETKTGLDDWNKRLDENLEPKDHNDEIADEKAKDFSEQFDGDNEQG